MTDLTKPPQSATDPRLREPLESRVGSNELGGTGKVPGGDPVADRQLPKGPDAPHPPSAPMPPSDLSGTDADSPSALPVAPSPIPEGA
jgi:hypothetical protein